MKNLPAHILPPEIDTMNSLHNYDTIANHIDYSKPWDGRVQAKTVMLDEASRKNGASSELHYAGESTRSEGNYRGQGIHERTSTLDEELSQGSKHISHDHVASTLERGKQTGQAAQDTYTMHDTTTGKTTSLDKKTYEQLFKQMTAGKEQWFAQNRVTQ